MDVSRASSPLFGTTIPSFIAKLLKIVEDPQTNEIISWDLVCLIINLYTL